MQEIMELEKESTAPRVQSVVCPPLPESLQAKISEAQQILASAIYEHNPSHIFAMFSGGYDSLVNAHIAAQLAGFTACVHIHTGIAIKKTRVFVRDTCDKFGWNLFQYNAKANKQKDGTPEQTYEELVLERGFPGAAHHRKMYDRLKGRSVQRLMREHKRIEYRVTKEDGEKKLKRVHRRILLVTGIRQQESLIRMGYTNPVQRIGSQVWVNPIFFWSKRDRQDYMEAFNLPLNPVVEALCMSGECLCGAYASKGELVAVKTVCPETGAYLEDLQSRVKERGFPWGWEDKPPESHLLEKQGQGNLFLCSSCEFKHQHRDAQIEIMVTQREVV